MLLHAVCLLSVTWLCGLDFCRCWSVSRPLVCFSGTEDSYTVTCGMPLSCLADAQKNNSGLYCLGKYKTSQIYIDLSALPHKTVTKEQLVLSLDSVDTQVDQNDVKRCSFLSFVLQVRKQPVFLALRPQLLSGLALQNAT